MPPTDPASRPNPWLSLLLPLVVSAATAGASFAVQWGTLGADVRHMEASHTKLEARVVATDAALGALATRTVAVEAEQLSTRRQMETELAGVRRELERVARALERLTDDRPRSAHR